MKMVPTAEASATERRARTETVYALSALSANTAAAVAVAGRYTATATDDA